jgi:hypothetical protein
MTDLALNIAISRFIENASLEDLYGMAQEGLEAYFKDNPKESLAFVMEWNPDDTTDPELENNQCH